VVDQTAARTGPDAGVPRSPDDVDCVWLTDVLGPAVGPSAHVADVLVGPVGIGIGLLGQLRRYTLRWEGGDGPASVVAKFPAAGDKSRALAEALAMYPREVAFYRDLGAATPLSVDCYHAAVDESTHDFVLVLEDMVGATTVDQLAGCPVERAEQVVTALADHHARHWDEAGLDRAPWLERFVEQGLPGQIAAAVRVCWPGIRARFADELAPGTLALGDGLADALPRIADRLSRRPVTLSHGDLRLDNVFFADGSDGVRLCDWQLTGRSRGMRDVAYFLTQSLTPGDRRAAELDLVARYVRRLASQGVRSYDEDAAWEDYRTATLLGFAYAIVALGGLDQDDDRSAALPRAMLSRSVQAMADLGCSLPER